MKSTIFVVVLICCVLAIDTNPISNCSAATTCDACITQPTCVWCLNPQTVSTPRCFNPQTESTSESSCPEEYTYDPMATVTFLKATDDSSSGSSYGDSNDSEGNYITPQHVRASMRIGNEIRMRTIYVVKEDLPVDIYLIMDMRTPTAVKNQQLNSLASIIADTMRNATSDFRFGFGYIAGSSRPVIHHTPMTTDTSALLHSVQQLVTGELPVSGEASLDAIVETACAGNVGWRTKSKKIIIFATDRDYKGQHYDVNIRKTETGSTSHICNRDVSGPSVQSVYQPAEISDLLNEKQIYVVFAVTDDVAPKYRELQDRIGYNSNVTSLTADTSNLRALLENFYMDQSLDISLTDNSSPFVSVTYFTKCLTEAETETNKCDGVKVGDRVIYSISLKLLSCPANSNDWNQQLQIRPENLNGQLTVDLQLICSCPAKTQRCHGNGQLVNDVCQCNDNYFGDYCECAGELLPSNGCQANDTESVVCSGRGECVCDDCACEQRENPQEKIYGQYCECDNFSCDYGNGLLCSGRGTCVCGQCHCIGDWSGSSCDCSTNTETCISPSDTNQAICSGHGECICGKCQCSNDKDGTSYTGQYCTTGQ